jgi:putative glutathione S-transferase
MPGYANRERMRIWRQAGSAQREVGTMGQMVDGVWRTEAAGAIAADGGFVRPATAFRDHIAPGGKFPAAAGRYHLYVSLACPWAHRTLIFRVLKGLQGMVGVSVTHWLMGDQGWVFDPHSGPGSEGVVPDPLGARMMQDVYRRADPHFTGRVSVPVLWDLETGTIVNNESGEIIRMFNSAFDGLGAAPGDYYPAALSSEIDVVNERVYGTLNNGVYRAGFATTQAAYDAAVAPLFATMDWLEARLSTQPFLCGEWVTEADWRLFTTLIRFDSVYHGHFKCNVRRVVDYPALWDYLRSLYQAPGIAETVDFGHIKQHYYMSHPWVNPTRIVPAGPALDLSQPGSRRVAVCGGG